jgi:hypothetical protein
MNDLFKRAMLVLLTIIFFIMVVWYFYTHDESKGVQIEVSENNWVKYDYFCTVCYYNAKEDDENIAQGTIEVARGEFNHKIFGIRMPFEGKRPNAVYYLFNDPKP